MSCSLSQVRHHHLTMRGLAFPTSSALLQATVLVNQRSNPSTSYVRCAPCSKDNSLDLKMRAPGSSIFWIQAAFGVTHSHIPESFPFPDSAVVLYNAPSSAFSLLPFLQPLFSLRKVAPKEFSYT